MQKRRTARKNQKNKMVTIKYKEIEKMSKEEREKKLKELKLELTKSLGKAGGRVKEIKKIIARINTVKQ